MKTIIVTSKMIIETVEKTLMNHCAFCTKRIAGALDVMFETEHDEYQLTMSLTRDLKSISFRSKNTYSNAYIRVSYSDGYPSTQTGQYEPAHEFIAAVMCDVQKNLEKLLTDNAVDVDE